MYSNLSESAFTAVVWRGMQGMQLLNASVMERKGSARVIDVGDALDIAVGVVDAHSIHRHGIILRIKSCTHTKLPRQRIPRRFKTRT